MEDLIEGIENDLEKVKDACDAMKRIQQAELKIAALKKNEAARGSLSRTVLNAITFLGHALPKDILEYVQHEYSAGTTENTIRAILGYLQNKKKLITKTERGWQVCERADE